MSQAPAALLPGGSPARILVIRRDNIGDLVCTTPLFAALRRHYPQAQIGALVNSYNAEVLRGNPHVDAVFVYQKLKHAGGIIGRLRALVQRLALIIRLRRWRPDVTILAKASFDRHGLNFARQIGARRIIGFVPDDLAAIKALPDIRLPTPVFSELHEVEAVQRLLAPLGIVDAPGPLQVFPDAAMVARLREVLSAKAVAPIPRIALHISAREAARRWGIDHFISLSKALLEVQPTGQLVLFWSPGQADDAQHPGDDLDAERLVQALNTAGFSERLRPMPTQNLSELIAALSLCDLFIGTDGGALHLAVALNKPVVTLFENRPDKLNHWYPWQVPHRILHSNDAASPAVQSITPAAVLAAAQSLLMPE